MAAIVFPWLTDWHLPTGLGEKKYVTVYRGPITGEAQVMVLLLRALWVRIGTSANEHAI